MKFEDFDEDGLRAFLSNGPLVTPEFVRDMLKLLAADREWLVSQIKINVTTEAFVGRLAWATLINTMAAEAALKHLADAF